MCCLLRLLGQSLHVFARLPADLPPCQVTVSVLNWIAPCTVRAPLQKIQAAFLGVNLQETQEDNLGIILMPMFAHKKSMLWVTETTMMKLLGENRVSFDLPFQMKFSAHNDNRDERPLSYTGRIATSATGKVHKGIFRNTTMIKENQTLPAVHELSIKMISVEDTCYVAAALLAFTTRCWYVDG
jgi:hypothetical protein